MHSIWVLLYANQPSEKLQQDPRKFRQRAKILEDGDLKGISESLQAMKSKPASKNQLEELARLSLPIKYWEGKCDERLPATK